MSYNDIEAGTTERFFTVLSRSTGAPITTGTVNYCLKAKSGANSGKWWRNSDETWQVAETANAMSHDADGHWEIDLTSSPFTADVRYLEYAKESGDLHIPISRHLIGRETDSSNITVAATATVLTAIDDGGNVQVRRGDRVSFGITGLGSLSGRSGEKLFFTVKTSKTNDLTDANAILQITETSSCVLVNGAAPGAASDATLTVDDATSGDITIILKSAVTNELTVGSRMFYDVQMIRSDGEPVTLTEGRFEVVADVTRRESL